MRLVAANRMRTLMAAPLGRSDSAQVAVAGAALTAALVGAFIAAGVVHQLYRDNAARMVASQSRALQQAERTRQGFRTGSIVIAQDYGGCEELRFDNFTGQFISVAEVDCDQRLQRDAVTDDRAPGVSPGLRGMLGSFNK